MAIPLVLYAGSASQVLPVLAALRHGRALPRARRWIVAWALVMLAADALDLFYSIHRRENLWLGNFFSPFEFATLLFALAWWHPKGPRRSVMRAIVPALVVIWFLLIEFVETGNSFNLVAGPLKSLVLLVASVSTLLFALRSEEDSLVRQDWFWITIGLALKYGCEVALEPFSRMLVQQHPDLVMSALKAKSVADVIASLVIAGGILCPIPPLRASFGPTSPASSPSPSSSPHSAPPW